MNFKSYCEIENSYNSKFIKQIREHAFDSAEIEWIAEVKIDGSNLQCCLDCDDQFIVGSRTRFLKAGTDFQGYERAMRNENVQDCLIKMKSLIRERFSENFDAVKNNRFVLRVYGELCGGMYRHPDIEKVKGAVKIQGRVSYHPDNVWIPFDIELTDENDNIIFVFSQTAVVSLCKSVGLPTPIIIKKGTFDELINLPNDFNDPTGQILFGLPKIENNITEGIVIKPNELLRFKNGSRVMVKSKNDKFKEKTKKEPKKPKEIIPMNELELKYFELYREFITESRLLSVISKIGNVNNKAFGMILGMFMKDLYNDFDKEYGEEIKKLEDTLSVDEFNLAKTKKELAKEIIEFIRPIFIQHINE
jgi:Rnl2 family RNA ligase